MLEKAYPFFSDPTFPFKHLPFVPLPPFRLGNPISPYREQKPWGIHVELDSLLLSVCFLGDLVPWTTPFLWLLGHLPPLFRSSSRFSSTNSPKSFFTIMFSSFPPRIVPPPIILALGHYGYASLAGSFFLVLPFALCFGGHLDFNPPAQLFSHLFSGTGEIFSNGPLSSPPPPFCFLVVNYADPHPLPAQPHCPSSRLVRPAPSVAFAPMDVSCLTFPAVSQHSS